MQLERQGKLQVLPVSKQDIVRRLEHRGPIDAVFTVVKLPHDHPEVRRSDHGTTHTLATCS
jgi:hypothetical protein